MKMQKLKVKSHKYICILVILCSSVLLATSPSYAQEKIPQALKVSPIIIPLQLSPSKTTTEIITVENVTDNALPLHANFTDFQTESEDGGYIFTDTHTNPLLSWMQLSETDLLLAPKQKKEITLTIKTPSSIPVGGYYGMIFFEPVGSVRTGSTTVVSRIGILVLGDLGIQNSTLEKAQILNFSLGGIQERSPLPLLLRVKNTSLHYFTAKPFLTLTPLLGKKQTILLEEKIVFPTKVRRWNYPLTITTLPINIYKAHMAVSIGNGEQVTHDTYLIIFPTTKALVLLLIVLLLSFVIIRRKQIKNALRILIKNS